MEIFQYGLHSVIYIFYFLGIHLLHTHRVHYRIEAGKCQTSLPVLFVYTFQNKFYVLCVIIHKEMKKKKTRSKNLRNIRIPIERIYKFIPKFMFRSVLLISLTTQSCCGIKIYIYICVYTNVQRDIALCCVQYCTHIIGIQHKYTFFYKH